MRASLLVTLLASASCYRSHPPPIERDGGSDASIEGPADATCSSPLEPAPRREDVGPPLGPLSEDGCRTGSLAGLDPTGEWWIFLLPEGADATDPDDARYEGARPLAGLEVVRFEPDCAPPAARLPLSTAGPEPVRLTPDELFLLVHEGSGEGEVAFALEACNASSSGRLWGHWATCFAHGCVRGTAALEHIGRIAGESDAEGLRLVGRWASTDPRPTLDLDVLGPLVALARGSDGVVFVDVSDPTHPAEVGRFTHDASFLVRAELVATPATGALALVETAGDGVLVVDVGDPAQPTLQAVLADRAAAVASGRVDGRLRAFVLDPGTLELTVWDLEDPSAPTLLQAQRGAYCAPLRLSFGEGVLAAGCGSAGLLTARASGQGVGPWRWSDVPGTVARASDEIASLLIVADPGWAGGLRTALEDGPSFVPAGRLAPRSSIGARDVAVDGTRVTVASLQDGVRIVDVSEPSAPRPVAHYHTWDGLRGRPSLYEGARAVRFGAAGELVFVADWAQGLLVLSTAPP